LSAATNAWFAKNGAQALELLSQAKSEVQALDSLIDENKEILEKFGYYVSFKDQVRAIMNVISANEKAWTGQNPNRDLSKCHDELHEQHQELQQNYCEKYEAPRPCRPGRSQYFARAKKSV